MMRELHEAEALHVQAPTTEVFKSRTLWRIKGKRGIFRGVAREGRSGLKAATGNIVAVHSADLLDEFRLDKETTNEVALAFPTIVGRDEAALAAIIDETIQVASSKSAMDAIDHLRRQFADFMKGQGNDAEN